jgi:hypothetical protein
MSETLSPYEEGYLLGRRYALENGDRPRAYSKGDGRARLLQDLSGLESKREIEMRMQALTKRPPRL